jgi:hypothetical protein
MAGMEKLHEMMAVHTNAIGTLAVGGTEPDKAERDVPHNVDDQAGHGGPVPDPGGADKFCSSHDERATCQTSQNRTFCAYCTVHPTRPQDAQSRRYGLTVRTTAVTLCHRPGGLMVG